MSYQVDDLRRQARKYFEDLDAQQLLDSIDFSKVDTHRLKNLDFSGGMESARRQLEQLPRLRVTTQPPVLVDEHDEGGFLGGLLLGVVLGAILALLFAPKSGRDTRDMVKNTVTDLTGRAGSVADEIEVGMNQAQDTISEEVEEALSDEPAIERNYGA